RPAAARGWMNEKGVSSATCPMSVGRRHANIARSREADSRRDADSAEASLRDMARELQSDVAPSAGVDGPGRGIVGPLPSRGSLRMRQEVRAAVTWASLATLVLAGLIVAGSRSLAHFDAALVAYTFASLFAAFGIVYRYAMWLQRPPTAVYWRRGFQVFLRGGHLRSHLRLWGRAVAPGFPA